MTPLCPRLPAALLLALLVTLTLPAPSAAADATLGRLFFTPERRQAMDRQRLLNQPEKPETENAATLTLNGVLTRNSGRRTVWINGVAQHDNEAPDGIRATPEPLTPARVVLRPGDAPETRMAVGDTLIRGTGETTPLLGDGQIRVPPSPAIKR